MSHGPTERLEPVEVLSNHPKSLLPSFVVNCATRERLVVSKLLFITVQSACASNVAN